MAKISIFYKVNYIILRVFLLFYIKKSIHITNIFLKSNPFDFIEMGLKTNKSRTKKSRTKTYEV